uniref:Uncharacterized protein n=1 Tax=Meloidogyne incognita TaxID=6306 RepID=A0A914NCB1_MELIC
MNSQAPKRRGRPAKAKAAPAASVPTTDKSPPKPKSPISAPNGEAKSPVKPLSPVKPPSPAKSPVVAKKGRGRPKGAAVVKKSPPKKPVAKSVAKGGVTKKAGAGKRGRPAKKNATSEESSGDDAGICFYNNERFQNFNGPNIFRSLKNILESFPVSKLGGTWDFFAR